MLFYTKLNNSASMSIFALLVLMLTSLMGCEYYKPVTIPEPKQVIIKENPELLKAAHAIHHAIIELKALEKSVHPKRDFKILPELDNYKMHATVTLDWVGELELLLASIAKQFNYTLKVLGKQPTISLLVNISVKEVALSDVIRNAHVQAGKQANIFVYPKERVIELRYA